MQMRRLVQGWVIVAAVALLALFLAAVFLFRLFPSETERPVFEKGDLLVCANGDVHSTILYLVVSSGVNIAV